MNQVTRTHNAFHLGDNLVHLNFLRRVALSNPERLFVHACPWEHARQLREVVAHVPNISISEIGHSVYYANLDFGSPSHMTSINAWRGAGDFWYKHKDRNDFVKFHLESWFPYLSERMEVDNPVRTAKDMLFDYPGLHFYLLPAPFCDPFDVLLINSRPGSGQFQGYDEFLLGQVAVEMVNKGVKVITTSKIPDSNIPCTADVPMSVTGIGRASLNCHSIVMVSTGPSWPTFNVWNQESVRRRIIFLEPERVNISPNTIHCGTVVEASNILHEAGLL